jgi:hypothetical protein
MFPFPEREQELGVSLYNVATGTFAFLERRRSQNVEHGNGNVSHVPIPKLLSSRRPRRSLEGVEIMRPRALEPCGGREPAVGRVAVVEAASGRAPDLAGTYPSLSDLGPGRRRSGRREALRVEGGGGATPTHKEG